MTVFTIYSRPGCHLCDEMKALVRRIVPGDASVVEIDISTDPALEALYGLDIPVLMLNGKKVAKYRIDENALRRLIASRQAASQ